MNKGKEVKDHWKEGKRDEIKERNRWNGEGEGRWSDEKI